MNFTLTFKTDNADFDGGPIDFTEAVACTLERVGDEVGLGELEPGKPDSGPVLDRNGNVIGRWALA